MGIFNMYENLSNYKPDYVISDLYELGTLDIF